MKLDRDFRHKIRQTWSSFQEFIRTLTYSKDHYAFGVEKTYWKYRLRYARYWELANTIAHIVRARESSPVYLLDIGVGRGRTLQYLEIFDEVIQKIEFFGIDIKKRRLNSVYKPDQWHLVQANLENGLPFSNEAFDIVICEQVLEHLSRPHAAIDRIEHVLAEDGTLIAGVPIFPPLLYQIRRHIVPKVDEWFGIERGHEQVFTNNTFTALLNNNDHLTVQDTRGFRFISGGLLGFLENYRWWWQFQRKLGHRFPGGTIEVQAVAKKTASD